MADKKGTPLTGVTGFTAEILAKLAAFWIVNCEDLVSTAVGEGGLAGLVSVLGLGEGEVVKLVEAAQAALPPTVSFAPGDIQPQGLGALDEREPGEEKSLPPSFAPLPPSVDLRAGFGPVRNQGQRGTCVAHAGAAVREYLLQQKPPALEFSEQFHYWDCKQNDLIPNLPGTYIKTSMARLQESGIPLEAAWPYNSNPIPGNEGQGPAPQGAAEAAVKYRITKSTRLVPTDVEGLCQSLSENKPISFAVPVYNYWFAEPVRSSGDVRLPLPGEPLAGGHAMCMVGYQQDEATPGGGYFLVRNSWGTSWASRSAVEPGYARIPFAYIRQYANSAFNAEASVEPVPPVEKSGWQKFVDWLRRLFG